MFLSTIELATLCGASGDNPLAPRPPRAPRICRKGQLYTSTAPYFTVDHGVLDENILQNRG